jgi:hypothetical protein
MALIVILLLTDSNTFCAAAWAPTGVVARLTGELPEASVTAAVCASSGNEANAANTINTATSRTFRLTL